MISGTPPMGADASTFPICGILIALVPLTPAGLALMNCGFGRARSAAHSMLSSLSVMAIAAIVYCLLGFSLQGFAGGPARVFLLGGKPWDWIACQALGMRGLVFNGAPATQGMLLQVFTVGIAALIPVSTGAGRWRQRSIWISTALLAGWSYPLFAHWAWGGGWLAQLGTNFNLGHGFLDAGGAGTVHVMGGLSALAIAWTLGPRRGKYLSEEGSAAIPGHNVVYVLFGCAVIIPGWIALNSAGAILFAGAESWQIPLIAVNTMLSSSASCLVAVIGTRIRFGKPDASLCANGWMAGLISSSAVCCFVTPLVAILIGLVAGMLVGISVEALEVFLTVDDSGGAISVHTVAGIWGLLALGILPRISNVGGLIHPGAQNNSGQLLAQVVGIATLLGLMLPMIYGLNLLLNRIDPQRVDLRGERLGMDLEELGGGAYPEFVIHNDE